MKMDVIRSTRYDYFMIWKKRLLQSLLIVNLFIILAIWFPYSGRLIMDWYMESYSFGLVFKSIANLAGLLAAFLVLLQILLVSRAKWLEGFFGLDKLSRWHHIFGFLIPVFIIVHPVLLVVGASMIGKTRPWAQFMGYVNYYEGVPAAAVSFLLFLLLIGLSVLIVYKKLKYETWYFTHVFMYAAVLLAMGHQFSVGSDLQAGWPRYYWMGLYIFTFANLVIYRFWRPAYQSIKHAFRVQKVVVENQDCVSIYIAGRGLNGFKVKPGQFFIMRFLDKHRWWQAHPFSLSCAPNGQYLRITVKNLGDYTSRMRELRPGTRVVVDGPHGVFTPDQAITSKYLLIAGGIGLTPLMSMAQELAKENQDVIFLRGARTQQDLILTHELNEIFKQSPNSRHDVLSHDEAWLGERGVIDLEKIERLAPDLRQRDIYVCGPSIMMKNILHALKQAGVPKRQIHFEKFSL